MKRASPLLAALLVLVALVAPASAEKGRSKKPEPFEVTGHVYLSGALPLTFYEFGNSSCPDMPVTQGLTSFVVRLPDEVLTQKAYLEAGLVTSPTGFGGRRLISLDKECRVIGGIANADEPIVLPSGTRFVVMHQYENVNYDITLRVTPIPVDLTPAGDLTDSVSEAEPTVKPFTATGHITAPGIAPVTMYDFIRSCPEMPSTQGLTAYVVEIPAYLQGRWDTEVTVDGGGAVIPPGVDFYLDYYDATCAPIDPQSDPSRMPPGAAFIIVSGRDRVDHDFTLWIRQRPDLIAGPVKTENPARPKVSPRKAVFETSGSVAAIGLVTSGEFIFRCPEMPVTQGLTAYLIEIPEHLREEPDLLVEVVGRGELSGYDESVQLSFFNERCNAFDAVDSPAEMPVGAVWILVQPYDVNFDFALTILKPAR